MFEIIEKADSYMSGTASPPGNERRGLKPAVDMEKRPIFEHRHSVSWGGNAGSGALQVFGLGFLNFCLSGIKDVQFHVAELSLALR